MDENRLSALPLFASLSKHERRELASCADEVDIREGKHLVDEGAFAYEFFVIEDGEAEVVRGGEHVADLGPGDFLGEIGAHTRGVRNASVIAKSPLTAIVMTARDFRNMERKMPSVAEQIQSAIEERTRELVAS